MSLGIYISVPFCRTKCSFCNFASGVFSRAAFDRYTAQVCAEISSAETISRELGGQIDRRVDSIYLGGGTPSVLAPDQLERLFRAVRRTFDLEPAAEITVECAPGTLSSEMLDAVCRCGVNRVSLGVQSFVDQECSSVGRLHTRAITLDDIARLRAVGIGNIGIDLIAGLPHQTPESWNYTLSETLATGVPHVSVYMLEVDEDSRLGSELLAGGSRYHAHFVPDDDLTADLYLEACEKLERGAIHQYEISNFARSVTHGIGLRDSRHNLKYWTRQPYLGFGVDAHSMLWADHTLTEQGIEAVRFATPDSVEEYTVAGNQLEPIAARVGQLLSSRALVDAQAALEESFFLGLRMNQGVSLREIAGRFGEAAKRRLQPVFEDLVEAALLDIDDEQVRLTSRGRLLSNEVFGRFLRDERTVRS
ncbi:MAG TPA: radical SAM family heme chaperone HemW [Candidatus Eisenbacteria bacterium]|nr:radical SAM family heme chaperone HemW [Candidatus Eisenbacteria bacterium]